MLLLLTLTGCGEIDEDSANAATPSGESIALAWDEHSCDTADGKPFTLAQEPALFQVLACRGGTCGPADYSALTGADGYVITPNCGEGETAVLKWIP